jgi:formate--tetrahydrofolate ligase
MTDIDIARAAKALPINEIGAKLGILPSHLIPYGHNKAKVSNEFFRGDRGSTEWPTDPRNRHESNTVR